MDEFLNAVRKIWENGLVQAIVYLAVAVIVGWIASFLVKKLLKFFKLDTKIGKFKGKENAGAEGIKFIGKLVFLIVFLLFLPPALESLGLDSVSAPITGFAETFVGYIPEIIAALIVLVIGIFIGEIAEKTITGLLAKTKIDNLSKKYASRQKESSESEITQKALPLSGVIGMAARAVIILLFTVEALTILNIEVISKPALTVINAFFGAIPDIILAAAVIAGGVILAGIISALLESILRGVGFDSVIAKALPMTSDTFSVTRFTVAIVRALIILFVIAEGVDILNLSVLGSIMKVVISYLPMVIKALIIAIAAYFGSGFITSLFKKAMPKMKLGEGLIKSGIYTVAGFMILSQLGFASVIVNYAFIIILSAIAVAFAIAFGIGGKDFAKKTLTKIGSENTKGSSEADGADQEN